MALSKNVLDNLEEAKGFLRAALANAARSEKTTVNHHISEVLVAIDRIIKSEEFSDKLEDMLDRMKKDGNGGSSFFGGMF